MEFSEMITVYLLFLYETQRVGIVWFLYGISHLGDAGKASMPIERTGLALEKILGRIVV